MQRSQSDATTRLHRLISQSHKIPTANLRLCNKWIQRSITVAKEPFDHEARHRGTETENCSESFRLLERCVVSANQIRLQRNNGRFLGGSYTVVPLSPSSIIWYRPMGAYARQLGRKPRAWRKVMAAYRRVYGFGHLRADCRGPGSAPEPYARFEYRTTYLCYLYLHIHLYSPVNGRKSAIRSNAINPTKLNHSATVIAHKRC